MFPESIKVEVLRRKSIHRLNATFGYKTRPLRSRYIFHMKRIRFHLHTNFRRLRRFRLVGIDPKRKTKFNILLYTFYSFVSRRPDKRRNCAHFKGKKSSAACHLRNRRGVVQMEPPKEICFFRVSRRNDSYINEGIGFCLSILLLNEILQNNFPPSQESPSF